MRGALIWPLLKRRAATASGAVEPQCTEHPGPPKSEPVREHRAGSKERGELQLELSLLCRNTRRPHLRGQRVYHRLRLPSSYAVRPQAHSNVLQPSLFAHHRDGHGMGGPDSAVLGADPGPAAIPNGGRYRRKIIAAAMMGQGMTAIQAEHNICQLIDYTRFNSNFLRDLTMSRGIFAAITPNDSFSNAGQLAITPAIMGNGVVWKPSQYSILACYRDFPKSPRSRSTCGVINFVPAEENCFLNTVCCSRKLAGVAFGGTTSTLETIWKRIGDNIKNFDSWHGERQELPHNPESADMKCAVANTIRAAFEMAGQKTTSCSRAYVHHPSCGVPVGAVLPVAAALHHASAGLQMLYVVRDIRGGL
ncbi:hypothetical protein MSG28_000143 [Choristoneura fumiferana]|uniref:Uncharacterized protein n=1 Tax=Choristoneura fumiferana TaxID=7141 RepID=A0ACC0JZH7_CHOFU|nr:hypothetical protein MSG28_000143 [Choristoneura fumiferana]